MNQISRMYARVLKHFPVSFLCRVALQKYGSSSGFRKDITQRFGEIFKEKKEYLSVTLSSFSV